MIVNKPNSPLLSPTSYESPETLPHLSIQKITIPPMRNQTKATAGGDSEIASILSNLKYSNSTTPEASLSSTPQSTVSNTPQSQHHLHPLSVSDPSLLDILTQVTPIKSLLKQARWEIVQNGRTRCAICDKDFFCYERYETHYKIHNGKFSFLLVKLANGAPRPFNCLVCNKKFLRRHDLNRHERIHMGVKPFTCSRCGKGFVRKDALKRHQKMDPSVRRYRCVVGVSDIIKRMDDRMEE